MTKQDEAVDKPMIKASRGECDFSTDEHLTPAKAIRAKCLECVGMMPSEVLKCTGTSCHLWPYRMGHGKDTAHINPPFRKKSMRLECLECMGGNSNCVKDCPSRSCAIWPYRIGRGICTDPKGENITPSRILSDDHLAKLQEGRKKASV